MAKRTRRRRRSWSRLLLLVVFVAAALYAGYFCLFRPPEVPAETTRPDEAEEVSAEDTAQDAEALAQAALADKKRAGDSITLVIPQRIGECELRKLPVSDLLPVIRAGLEA